MSLRALEQEVKKIKQRNARVEADKAWETSCIRKLLITLLTYIVFLAFFLIARLPRPWLSALVPTLAFLLSTLTLDVAKKRWIAGRR